MKFPLASWGVFLLGAAAVLGRGASNPDGAGGIWDDCSERGGKLCDDFQGEVKSAAGKPAFLRPLLRNRPLVDSVDEVRVVRDGGAFESNYPVQIDSNPPACFTPRTTSPMSTCAETGKVVRVIKGGVSESNQAVPSSRGFFVVAGKQAQHGGHQPSTRHHPFKSPSRNKFRGSASTMRTSPDSSSGGGSGRSSTNTNSSGGSGGSGRSSTTTNTSTTTTTTGCASPPCEELPNKLPAGYANKHDPPYSSSSASSSSSSSSSEIDKSNNTRVNSGVAGARKAATRRPLAKKKLTADYRVMQRTLHVLGKINEYQRKKKIAVSNSLRGSAFDRSTTRRPMVCPRDPWVRQPTCALQVGETVTGSLRQAEGGLALWPGTDESVRSRRVNPATFSSEDGGKEGPGSKAMRFATLLGSSPDKALEALDARKHYLEEEGGGDAGTGSKNGTVGGWLPWAQRAKKGRFDTVNASGKAKVAVGGWSIWARGGKRNGFGDVSVAPTISEEAATVDETTTLSKSVRSEWSWFNGLPLIRPQDDGNKAQETEAGKEVRRGRRTVWGVNTGERVG